LEDIPVFVKAGSIIPQSPLGNQNSLIGGAQHVPSLLAFNVFAFPSGKGSTSIYEDDGNTTAYISGAGVWTTVTYSQVSPTKVTVGLKSTGTFPGFPSVRSLQFKIIGVFNPLNVALNGLVVPYDPFTVTTPSWKYDGDILAIVVTTSALPTSSAVALDIDTSSAITSALLDGYALQVRRAKTVKGLLDNQFPSVYQETYAAVVNAASTGFRISANPAFAKAELAAFPALYALAIDQVIALTSLDQRVQNVTVSLLKDAQLASTSPAKARSVTILQDEL